MKLLTIAGVLTVFALVAGTVVAVPAAADRSLSGSLVCVSTAFLPSTDGFSFRNPLSPSPRVALLAGGRCGGMTYAALDYYSYGANAAQLAANDRRYLLARSTDSIMSNGLRFAVWTLLPDRQVGGLAGVGELTRTEELPKLAERIQSGPVALGLVRARKARDIGRNHQVIAYGIWRQGDQATVMIYDPNQPLRDDVVLEIDASDPSSPVTEYVGEWPVAEWRGLFVERYAPVRPPR